MKIRKQRNLFVQPIATPVSKPPPSEEAITEIKEAERAYSKPHRFEICFEKENIGVGR